MNSFFATTGGKLASRFPPTTVDKSEISRVTPTISEVVLDGDGSSKLKKLNIWKAYGCDGIIPKEMKIVAKEIW